MHSKTMFRERNFLSGGSRGQEIILNLNNRMATAGARSHPAVVSQKPYFLIIGQLPSASGRNASAAGIVSTSL
ncbi:hypothetical protein BH10PSE10_BH10PSE10_20920 [soil metagenome]